MTTEQAMPRIKAKGIESYSKARKRYFDGEKKSEEDQVRVMVRAKV